MLTPFGSPQCLRCETDLVQEYGVGSLESSRPEHAVEDEQWLCPTCGFTRPVVYALHRDFRRPSVIKRILRAMRDRAQASGPGRQAATG